MVSSPIDHIDGAYIVGEVALSRTAEPYKVCLLVEGQDDESTYRRLVNRSSCQLINCRGKENLLVAIDSLNQQETTRGYLGIKDADFDVVNEVPKKPNLLLTDGHDLEVMICKSEAFEKYIEVRLKGEESVTVDIVKQQTRRTVFEISAVLGYLQWLSQKYSWGINLPTFRIVDPLNQPYDLPLDHCIRTVKECSDPKKLDTKVTVFILALVLAAASTSLPQIQQA